MNRTPEHEPHSHKRRNVSRTSGVDFDVVLKNALTPLWESTVPTLLEESIRRYFRVYDGNRVFSEVIEKRFKEEYYRTLNKVAELGGDALTALAALAENQGRSVVQTAAFYDGSLSPVCRGMADILADVQRWLPTLYEEVDIRIQKEKTTNPDAPSKDTELAKEDLREAVRRSLRQAELGFRAFSPPDVERAGQVNLVEIAKVAATILPGIEVSIDDEIADGVAVETPPCLGHSAVMALTYEMLEVGREFRGVLRRALPEYSVFAIGAAHKHQDAKRQHDKIALLPTRTLVRISCSSTGDLCLGISVAVDDFDSLNWLKQRLSNLANRFSGLKEHAGIDIDTAVIPPAELSAEAQFSEYQLCLRFRTSSSGASEVSSFVSPEIAPAGCPKQQWRSEHASSIDHTTVGGRRYSLTVSESTLATGSFSCDPDVFTALGDLIDDVSSVDSLNVVGVVRAERGEGEDAADESEDDIGYTRGSSDDWDVEGSSPAGVNHIFTLSAAEEVANQKSQLNAASIRGTLHQLERVASMGFKAAGTISDPKVTFVPATNIVLLEPHVRDPEVMDRLSQIAQRFNIGSFEISVDPKAAAVYLRELINVTDEVLKQVEPTERLTVEFRSTNFRIGPFGFLVVERPMARFFNSSGQIEREGIFNREKGVFELTVVPKDVLELSARIIVEELREQLAHNDECLRIAAFCLGLENRGLCLADKILITVFISCKQRFEGVDISDDACAQIESILDGACKSLPILPPFYDGFDRLCILSEEDLPKDTLN